MYLEEEKLNIAIKLKKYDKKIEFETYLKYIHRTTENIINNIIISS